MQQATTYSPVTERAIRRLRRAQALPGLKSPALPASSCAARRADVADLVAPGCRLPAPQRRRSRPPARDARPPPQTPAPISPRAPTPATRWGNDDPPPVDRSTIPRTLTLT